MKTKLFTLFLALVTSVGIMSQEVDDEVEIGGLYYVLFKDLTAAVMYDKYMSSDNYSGLTTANIQSSITTYNGKTYCVNKIMNYAFWDCTNLTSVTIPSSVTSIGEGAFSGCTNLTSIDIPNSVTSIGDYAFNDCTGLTSPVYNSHIFAKFGPSSYEGAYTIPEGIESIALGAFSFCTSLTSITIPNSVTRIGKEAFDQCYDLLSVTCEATTPPELGQYAFSSPNIPIPLYVPAVSANAYKAAYGWKDFNPILPIDGGEEEITVRLDPVSATPWDNVYLYAWINSENNTTELCGSWPGIQVSKDSDGWWSCAFYESITPINIIWTDGNNYQTININNVSASTCYSLNSPYGNKITVNVVDCQTVKNTYTIRFVNYDDTELLKLTDVVEGTLPAYTGATPTRPSDDQYTYIFSGWSPTIVAATKDATYTAQYNAVPIEQATTATEIDNSTVSATPAEEGSVVLEWPAVENADTYTITIAKNGEIICSLIFDDEGHLISIAFAAPSRDSNGRNIPAAEQAAKGWRYEVKGLEAGAEYTYTITAKKEDESVLFTQSIDFTMPAPQGLNDINADTKAQKIIRNDQIFILRANKTYTVTGAEVR